MHYHGKEGNGIISSLQAHIASVAKPMSITVHSCVDHMSLLSAFDRSLKILIKPILAINLMTITSLMAIGVVFPTAALEVGNQYFCTGAQKTFVGGYVGTKYAPRKLEKQRGVDSLLQIKSTDKAVVHNKDGVSREYDIITQQKHYLASDIPHSWVGLPAEYTAYNIDHKDMPDAKYWRITFDGEYLIELQHIGNVGVHISECKKI